MKSWALLSSVFLLVLPAAGSADVPDVPCVTTTLDASQRLLMIPDNDGNDPSVFGTFTVTIKNSACNPINNAVVEVLLGGGTKTRLCAGAVTTRYTDAAGVATFNIAGGGCFKGVNAVVIRANGVIVREFRAVMSPDYAAWDNAGIADRWSLSITVVDFAAFATAVHNGGASCHDYDNNGTTGAADVSVFGQVWMGGTRRCSP